jgi:hypothetical protein
VTAGQSVLRKILIIATLVALIVLVAIVLQLFISSS